MIGDLFYRLVKVCCNYFRRFKFQIQIMLSIRYNFPSLSII